MVTCLCCEGTGYDYSSGESEQCSLCEGNGKVEALDNWAYKKNRRAREIDAERNSRSKRFNR